MSETEEGDVTAPLGGISDLNINLSEIKSSQKKKLCGKQVLKLGTTILGVMILIAVIIIFISLGLDKKEEDKHKDDQDEDKGEITPEDIYGNIICDFDINSGLINILSEEFEKNFYLITYIGDNKINYTKTYNFNKEQNKTVRYEIHSKNISIKNMFKGLVHLKNISFISNSGGKILSMESTFEQCTYLTDIKFKGWDTSELTSMKKAFASCSNLEKFPFDDIDLSNVKDMSYMLESSNIHFFQPNKFNLNSVETLSSMFQNCYGLTL